jgi:hypothetical protein
MPNASGATGFLGDFFDTLFISSLLRVKGLSRLIFMREKE